MITEHIPRNLDWEKLETFYYVAKAGKIAIASKQLKIAQPALSRTIRILERQLGVQLFFRSVHGLTLTPEGSTLLEAVSRMYEDLQTTIRIIRHEDGETPRRDYVKLINWDEWERTVRLDAEAARSRAGEEAAKEILNSAADQIVRHVHAVVSACQLVSS